MVWADARFRAQTAGYFSQRGALLRQSTLDALDCDVRSGVSRAAVRVLQLVKDALRRECLGEALREIDRAWRCLPDDSQALAPIYGRLLALEERDHDAALRLLQRVDSPDADVAALTVHSLLHLRRGDEACQHLEKALSDFCVIPDELLAHVATEILNHHDTHATGWIGLGPALEFVGELQSQASTHALEVRLDGEAVFAQPIRVSQQNGRSFCFKLPQLLSGAIMRVDCHGMPLLGSGLRVPLEFGLDGRAVGTAHSIAGWARMGWLPRLPVELCVEDEDGRRHLTKTRGLPQPGMRWPFTVDLRRLGIRGSSITISALMPDGRWLALPDTPLLLKQAVKLPGCKPSLLARWHPNLSSEPGKAFIKRSPPIDVIIPVYRGRQETLACIDAALTTVGGATILVVDDATDDPALAAALDEFAAAGRIVLLRNPKNLGFVASVNRALECNLSHDALLLNSDAMVFGDWLERLRAAAYRAPNVGTVTPFSNSGTIASYPRAGEHPLSAEEAAALHKLASSTNSELSHDIPVGVGFCLYVRRDCLREVGGLDASVFGKGYGEETDFCLRAQKLGWSHRLAADVFVYHAGGRSFGARRAALLDRSQRLINMRHSGYDRFIADFIAQDPLNPLRRRLDEQRLVACERPFVLLVTLALSGGVQRFSAERCRDIRARGFFPLVLRPHKPGDTRCCELWTDVIDVPNVRYDIPSDLGALSALLRGIHLEEIEIQHFLHIDARVIDMVRALNVPYDVFIHDYAWICPRITLIGGSGSYCGEPAVSTCDSCVERNGSHLGKDKISVSDLRQRSASWLQQARRVIAPSLDTATRLKKYFPVTIEVRAHAAPVAPTVPLVRSPLSKVVRVALIGAVGEHKGYRVLLNCARDAKTRSLPLEFVVIGYTENDGPLLDTDKVFITGRYSEGEASHLLRREKPDIAFFPSVWPETWCYALDEAVAVGLPVVAFDLGAIAERLQEFELGVTLPLDEEPRHINDRLLEFAARTRVPDRDDAGIAKGIWESTKMNYEKSDSNSAQNEAMSASVQVLPLPSGLYLFSVKAAGARSERLPSQLRLPAMHVGLGPGVRSEQVEFIAGPATDGAWLFAQEDMLVTKVSGAGATLILTSVRAPGGEVLSIKVERLESRLDAAAPALPAAAAPAATTLTNTKKKAKTESAANSLPGGPLPLKIGAHIRARGDMSFADVPWAGRVAPGLWIESFSIKPLERFEAQDIEYKGLTGSGFETSWLSDDNMCGTKGMSVPLVGFAVRLKPSAQAATYDCEYSGYFKSGVTIGPLRNGAPCRSTVANDSLEGIQVRICKRLNVSKPAAVVDRGAKPREVFEPRPAAHHGKGPSFGRYRDANGNSVAASSGAAKGANSGATANSEAANGDRKPMRAKQEFKRTIPEIRKSVSAIALNHRPIARR
jgi:GT2 family glycosyltransferase